MWRSVCRWLDELLNDILDGRRLSGSRIANLILGFCWSQMAHSNYGV